MPPISRPPPLDAIARKWCDLAQRRLDYYTELYRSGRWRHYYTEEALALRMLDVIKAVKLWAELSPARADDKDDLRPAA
jgi:uncharacterized repeat protein (TIGR03809 family)